MRRVSRVLYLLVFLSIAGFVYVMWVWWTERTFRNDTYHLLSRNMTMGTDVETEWKLRYERMPVNLRDQEDVAGSIHFANG